MTDPIYGGGGSVTSGGASSAGAPSDLKNAVRDQTNQTRHVLKDEASNLATEAKEKARDQVEQKKETATQTLGDFAEAIRRAGDELRDRDQSMAAQLAQQAAEGLSGLSRSLSNKSPEDMLHAAREFGRSNPTAFFAASVLAGLALGRVAGASTRHQSGGSNDDADRATSPYSSSSSPMPEANTAPGLGAGFSGSQGTLAGTSASTSMGDLSATPARSDFASGRSTDNDPVRES